MMVVTCCKLVFIVYFIALIFDLYTDKNATTRDEGASLTCQASIEFPPFSMLSLIKNGQTVAISSSGMLQINMKSVNVNPFGLYTCQLNASGQLFRKFVALKEQGTDKLCTCDHHVCIILQCL